MINEEELSLVKKLFRDIESSYNNIGFVKQISDIFVKVSLDMGEIVLYSDLYDDIGSVIIDSWKRSNNISLSDTVLRIINCAIRELEVEEFWESNTFCTPLNISLIDDNYNVVDELYYLDDDMVVLPEPLLSGYDEELDQFLKELLSQ